MQALHESSYARLRLKARGCNPALETLEFGVRTPPANPKFSLKTRGGGVLTPKSPHDVNTLEKFPRRASRAENKGEGGVLPRNGKIGWRAQKNGGF